ncbi:MAG TPA: gamma-glutamylcyclotransferase family protein [Acetobacteraceae bacterium]|nr:gamma-glutamylcyclotransferase family protein [Acetobacteraceae bacterium]
MSATRLLIATLLLATLSGAAFATDYWGRMLPGQPTDFIFGYGSLIDTASRNATAGRPTLAIPVRVSAAFGYVRTWDDRASTGFTALGLARAGPGEPAMTINGVLFPVEAGDLSAFDARESGYARIEVPRDDIEALSWERLPLQGRIWVYIPEISGKAPGVDLPQPNASFPLLQSYIDVVMEGGLEYGSEFAREIIETTEGWSRYWLNDRAFGRRPWMLGKRSSMVDGLLAAFAPHFNDRLFPEQYVVERLLAK